MTSAFATGPSTDDASGEVESVLLQVSLALALINYWQLRQREWGLIFVEQCTSSVNTVLKGKLTWTTLRLSEVKYPPSFVTPQPVKHWFEVYNCICFFVFLWQYENLRIGLESATCIFCIFVTIWELTSNCSFQFSSKALSVGWQTNRREGEKINSLSFKFKFKF